MKVTRGRDHAQSADCNSNEKVRPDTCLKALKGADGPCIINRHSCPCLKISVRHNKAIAENSLTTDPTDDRKKLCNEKQLVNSSDNLLSKRREMENSREIGVLEKNNNDSASKEDIGTKNNNQSAISKKNEVKCTFKSHADGDFSDMHRKVECEVEALECQNYPSDSYVLINKCIADEFRTLSEFIFLFFAGKGNGSADILFTFNEMMILSAILKKKLDYDLPVRNIYSVDSILELRQMASKRRSEECYKLVFKQAFKYLQKQYESTRTQYLKCMGHSAKVLSFYEYYFSRTASKANLSIDNFFLPLTSDAKDVDTSKVVAKTINSTYISLVLESTLFLEDLSSYLDSTFLVDYVSIVSNKIRTMVRKWEALISSIPASHKAIESICDFIVYNKKSKLPWFYSEIEYAVELVRQLISKHRTERKIIV